jgi:heavy metal translocating P-type ATPase
LRGAAYGLRTGRLRMEVLLAVGIMASFGYSAAQAFVGGKHYYFDTACAIITLVLLGKVLERGAKEKTAQSLASLYRMMPKKARLLQDGRERFVSIEALEPGMQFVVKAGERIPADGTVASGESHVDESVLTGESAPVAKGPGADVICGSLNTAGVLEIRASRVGADSTLSHIIRSVEAAMSSRSQVERTVDRVARIFVPIVCLIALATLPFGIMRAIAVLVIACPCALGIATPLAITAAVGACSRRGILVSDSRVLETVGKVDVVLFDKTGTVTVGDFSVLDRLSSDDALQVIAALEAYSEHPLGRAVVEYAHGQRVPIPAARDVTVMKGMGIGGRVRGLSAFAGNRRMVAATGASLDDAIDEQASRWEAQGRTVAFFGWDGAVTGTLALGDRVRPEAASVIAGLRERGIRTALISGDGEATTAQVASQLGVDDYRAEVLPAGKLDVIREYQKCGSVVAMVGDGVNDAPALAAADLGIALGSAAALAMQAAPLVLMSNDLDRVNVVFEAARKSMRVVRQNLFWAFFYNVAGISLAITGVLNPIMAAGAMVLSSLSVIGNSMRLRHSVGQVANLPPIVNRRGGDYQSPAG